VAQGNTGVGYGALGGLFGDSANDGWNNTAVGTYALNVNDNESGVGNLATGNTAVGSSALAMNTTGSDNTAAGFLALNSNLTGTNNTAVGTIAGDAEDQSLITGSGNTFLGFFAKMSTGTLNNATAIGAYALVAESNALVLGSIKGLNGATSNTNVGIGTATPDNMLTVNGSADKPGGGSWGTYSDRRLKTLDGNFNSGLSQIMKLRPVRYRYNKDNALGIQDEQEHVGLVAQDVQKVIPEAVTENNKGYLLLDNDPILWSMLNAIKEQQGLIRKQQSQMKAQQAEIARLRSQVRAIQDSLYTKGRTGSEVRTVKVQVPAIQQ
jgi:polyhydroxyalkanoate synthesis regulator phasin